MTPGELTARVTFDTCAVSAVLAALGGLVAGASVAGGVLAGGALAVLSFRWLVARAAIVTAAGDAPVSAWVIGAGLRFAACTVACAILLKTGWADPIGLFIVTANRISLVPGMGGPTSNLNTNAACALVVFVSYHWIGVRKQGALKYLAHFAGPVPLALKPLMFAIEIISHLARPLSLTLRLFGNMVGGHILLAVIFLLMGLDGLIGWALSGSAVGAVVGGIDGAITIVFTVGFLYPLKILVAFLQAFIFVMLTMLYISGAIEEAEHHSEHH